MNADNRANPAANQASRSPQRSSLRPITSDVPVTGQQRSPYSSAPTAPPVSGQQPVSGHQPVSGQQRVSAQPPVSSRPSASGQAPVSGQQPVSGQRPVTGQQPAGRSGAMFTPVSAPHPASTPVTPTTGSQPVSGQQPVGESPGGFAAGAAGVGATAAAGFDKLKGFAAKTKEDLTSADDIKASERKGGPRKVRVLVSRIDPWSALKIGFLLSIALGIMLVVAVYILWGALNSMGVFVLANEWVLQLFTENQEVDLLQFFELNKWMSAAVLIAVVNVVLLTALATLGAFLYNTISKVVGGFYVTLTDD